METVLPALFMSVISKIESLPILKSADVKQATYCVGQSDMPDEVLVLILSNLTQWDLSSCYCVCSSWRRLALDPSLWPHRSGSALRWSPADRATLQLFDRLTPPVVGVVWDLPSAEVNDACYSELVVEGALGVTTRGLMDVTPSYVSVYPLTGAKCLMGLLVYNRGSKVELFIDGRGIWDTYTCYETSPGGDSRKQETRASVVLAFAGTNPRVSAVTGSAHKHRVLDVLLTHRRQNLPPAGRHPAVLMTVVALACCYFLLLGISVWISMSRT